MRVRAAADNAFGPTPAVPPQRRRPDHRFALVRAGGKCALVAARPTRALRLTRRRGPAPGTRVIA